MRLERREREERECGPLFSNCLYVSPDCECAAALHNGGHCLFGGESVGFLFRSFLEVYCLTWWGISTSCGWRRACFLCPFPCLSTGISPLYTLCHPLNALIYSVFTPVEFFSDEAATVWIIFIAEQVRWE